MASLRTHAAAAEFSDVQRLDFDLLIVLEAGSPMHTVDFIDHRLAPGDIAWIHQGQVHRWDDITRYDGRVYMMSPQIISGPAAELFTRVGAAFRVHWPAAATPNSAVAQAFLALDEAISRVYDLDGDDSQARDAVIIHQTLATLATLVALSPPASTDMPTHTTAAHAYRQLRMEIENHFRHDRTAQSYARRVGYSGRTLHRLITSHTGMTPKAVIDERVILEAKRLLVHESTHSTEQIARHLGFSDPANFGRFFTRHTGLSPGQFRDSYR